MEKIQIQEVVPYWRTFIRAGLHTSTDERKSRLVSRIVPRLDGPVTTPRIDTHYIVTEFGVANLKGLSSTERAHALIGLAHPEFRDELREAARKLHLI
jgi:acyl-CoA hydrolase